MRQFIALFLMLAASGILMHGVHAESGKGSDGTLEIEASASIGDDDGTVDQGSGDAEDNDTNESADVSDDDGTADQGSEDEASDDSEDASDDDGSADQGNGDNETADDSEDASDDDGTADQGSGDVALSAAAETQVEIEAMDSTFGAKMRLLQLHFQLERRVLFGREVVARLDNKTNVSDDTIAKLEGIIDSLDDLSADAEEASEADMSKEDALAKFLSIKEESESLIADFRETVQSSLTDEEKKMLRKRFNEFKDNSLDRAKERIAKLRDDFNADRAEALLKILGEDDAALAAKIRAGELTPDEIRAEIRARFDDLTAEQKVKIALALKEEQTKRKIARADIVENIKTRVEERRVEIRQKVDERMMERREKIRERVMNANGSFNETRNETRIRSDGKLETRLRIRENVGSGSGDAEGTA